MRAVSQAYIPSLLTPSLQTVLLLGFVLFPILIDVVANLLTSIGFVNNPTVRINPDSDSYMLIQANASPEISPMPPSISLSTKFEREIFSDDAVTGLPKVKSPFTKFNSSTMLMS